MADNLEEDEWWLESTDNSEFNAGESNRKRKSLHTQEQPVVAKAKKKKKSRKRKSADTFEVSVDGKGTMAEVLWQFFWENMNKRLSPLELEELEISDSCFLKAEQESKEDSSDINTYLKSVIPRWSKSVKSLDKKDEKSSPIALVITSSAMRAVNINRSAIPFKGECRTAKLFAKHMKIEEQRRFLESHVVHLGVGTPNRVLKLLKDESLKVTNLKYLILDWNWRDQKQRTIRDIPEIREDLLKLLQFYAIPLARTDADDTNEESDLATVPAPQKNTWLSKFKMLFNWRTKIDFFSGENQDSYSAKKVKKSEVQSVASPSMADDCIVIAKESQV